MGPAGGSETVDASGIDQHAQIVRVRGRPRKRPLTARGLDDFGMAYAAANATTTVPVREPAVFSAERRQLTVMFCDLVGSTALSAKVDPEDMRKVILADQAACSGVVPTYDGFVAKFMGDGVLAYFGYPRANDTTPRSG
jgi:class 3 adenylate cyclase